MSLFVIYLFAVVLIKHVMGYPQCIRVSSASNSNNKFTGLYQYLAIEEEYPAYDQIDDGNWDNIHRKISVKPGRYTFTLYTGQRGPYCLDESTPSSPIDCSAWSNDFQIEIAECDTSTPTTTATATTAEKRFTISDDDPDQYIQIKDNTDWITDATSLLACHLSEDIPYIEMNYQNWINDIELDIDDNGILLMSSDVFEDPSLLSECKYPVLKILSDPEPEYVSVNDLIKIYVSTDVSPMEYIDDINVDVEELEMSYIDSSIIQSHKTTNEDTSVKFITPTVSLNEYTMECVENCDDFDEALFADYLQKNYHEDLVADKEMYTSDTVGGTASMSTQPARRRLGLWGWIEKTVIKPVVKTVVKPVVEYVEKEIIEPVADVIETIIDIVRGDVDESMEFGISIDETMSTKLTSEYEYSKDDSDLSVTISGEFELEYGVKFDLLLTSNFIAKWTYVPASFEHFKFTVGGKTEFLAWVKAVISAEISLGMTLLEKEKTFTFTVGPIPVVATLTFELGLSLGTAINAELMQQFGYEPLSVEFGIEYIDGQGWNKINDVNLDFKLINDRSFALQTDDEEEENTTGCPLGLEVELMLSPTISLTLYEMITIGLETNFGLVNYYNFGESCDDEKDVCDIINDNERLGLNIGVEMTCSVNLLLEAGISTEKFGIDLGITLWEDEFEIINLDDVIPNPLLDECFDLSYTLDTFFKENVCTCEPVDTDTDTPTETEYVGDLCVMGVTYEAFYAPMSSDTFKKYIYIQGDYSYGGVDSNDNDYWIMNVIGANCNLGNSLLDTLYIRKSELYNTYQISYGLYENKYITMCDDSDIISPFDCDSWSTDNLGTVDDSNPVKIIASSCPDLESAETLSVEGMPGSFLQGCNGEFTKDESRINGYLGDVARDDDFYWYYNYPQQKWMCTWYKTTYDSDEWGSKNCGSHPPTTWYDSATLSFNYY